MTWMLIIGALAAFRCLLLLFRCATFALPIVSGLGLAFAFRDLGFGWMGIVASGLLAGTTVHAFGRQLANGAATLAVRLRVILIFTGAASSAGYQAGAALAVLADLDPWTQRGFASLTAFVTGYASWRDLLSPPAGIKDPALHR